MKNYNYLFSIFLLILTISIFTTTKVNATVGGETVIWDFKYNPVDESVYYMNANYGGRGCPPELMKTSLNSEKSTVVFSCNQAEKLGFEKVNSEINKITQDFKPLTTLNLKANNISMDIKFVKSENYSSEVNEIMRRYFTASIYQNGKKIKELPITGCSLDQPFTFQGYSILGFNKKIIMIISAKGDCFEGGYISERLYVVGGVDNLDKTPSGNFFKTTSPLTPNEGNLVVYNLSTKKITSDTPKDEPIVKKEVVSSSTLPVVEKPIRESSWIKLINWFKNLF